MFKTSDRNDYLWLLVNMSIRRSGRSLCLLAYTLIAAPKTYNNPKIHIINLETNTRNTTNFQLPQRVSSSCQIIDSRYNTRRSRYLVPIIIINGPFYVSKEFCQLTTFFSLSKRCSYTSIYIHGWKLREDVMLIAKLLNSRR